MKNPFRRKPKDKTDWKKIAQELELKCKGLEASFHAFSHLDEANLRLIHELRQMDQWAYNLYQCAPDWNRMRPIVAEMYSVVEKRMEVESNRVKHLMIGEIRQAYNEPKPLPRKDWGKAPGRLIGKHEGTPIYEVPKIEDKS